MDKDGKGITPDPHGAMKSKKVERSSKSVENNNILEVYITCTTYIVLF